MITVVHPSGSSDLLMPAPAKTSLMNISNSSSLKFFHPLGSLKDCCPNAEIRSVNKIGNRSSSVDARGSVLGVVLLFPFHQSLHPRHVGTPGTLDMLSYASYSFFLSFFFQLCQGPQRGWPLIMVVGMGEEVLHCQGPDTIGV